MFLTPLAHLVLRVFVGLAFLTLGYQHFHPKHGALSASLAQHFPRLARVSGGLAVYLALVEIVLGLLFIAGLFTQAAAIGACVLSLKMLLYRKTFAYPLAPSALFWFMILGVSISLFITGAGPFAIDMPL